MVHSLASGPGHLHVSRQKCHVDERGVVQLGSRRRNNVGGQLASRLVAESDWQVMVGLGGKDTATGAIELVVNHESLDTYQEQLVRRYFTLSFICSFLPEKKCVK